MCRWIAYKGEAIFLSELLTSPEHSLLHQSYDSLLSASKINADGFGMSWYNEKNVPACFRDSHPAWNNLNFKILCENIKSHLFFGHIRAASSGAVANINCHPFRWKHWIFMHNGELGSYDKIRYELIQKIDPKVFNNIEGTTDSEVFFHLLISNGLEKNIEYAFKKTILDINSLLEKNKSQKAFTLTACLSDGKSIWASRYSNDSSQTRSLFYCQQPKIKKSSLTKNSDNIVICSEPLGKLVSECWTEVKENSLMKIEKNKLKISKLI